MDLSDYVKSDHVKGTTDADIFKIATKSYLVSLKAQVHELDVDKRKIVTADLS